MATEQTSSRPLVVYFGTAARGPGILVYELNQQTGRLTERGVTEIKGRGWVELDPTERFLYAATDPDRIDAFAIDRSTGALAALNSSRPDGSVSHLSVDPTSRFVVGASYGGGAVSVVSINADGSLGGPTDVVPHVPGPAISRPASRSDPGQGAPVPVRSVPAAGSPSTTSGWIARTSTAWTRRAASWSRTPRLYPVCARSRPAPHLVPPEQPLCVRHQRAELRIDGAALGRQERCLPGDRMRVVVAGGLDGKEVVGAGGGAPVRTFVYASNRGSGRDRMTSRSSLDQESGNITTAGHAETFGTRPVTSTSIRLDAG